ncbi:hypothetical protein F4803DRAFT_551832 [Xylaria telfairii]|nr:hypothetical protein F4803DRAFT_551832 [Xylaria telfairii]
MDADMCAASRALMDWDMAYRNTHGEKRSSLHPDVDAPSPSHSPSSSSSPSFSSESESYPLSRCSSVSSFSSAYSDSDTPDTEECADDARFLISILKKPRLLRRGKQQQQPQACERQMSQHDDNSSSPGTNNGNGYADNQGEEKHEPDKLGGDGFVKDDEDDEWQDCDDESECDIIFERNVTFDDPLATDIVTGVPVAPSRRSRVEWAALIARERLERRMGFLAAFIDEEGDDLCHDLPDERPDNFDIEADSKRERELKKSNHDDCDIDAYVLDITEAAAQFVELERLR